MPRHSWYVGHMNKWAVDFVTRFIVIAKLLRLLTIESVYICDRCSILEQGLPYPSSIRDLATISTVYSQITWMMAHLSFCQTWNKPSTF